MTERATHIFRVWLWRLLAVPILLSCVPVLAQTNTNSSLAGDIPPLRDPLPEIRPTFMEQNGAVVIGGSLLTVLLISAAGYLLLRPKPKPPVEPEVEARAALSALHGQAETGTLLSKVSQVLTHYFSATFALPPGEKTTAEFCKELAGSEQVGPDLGAEAAAFLKRCDEYKFAPLPPGEPLHAVDRAEALVDKAHVQVAAWRDKQAREAAARAESVNDGKGKATA